MSKFYLARDHSSYKEKFQNFRGRNLKNHLTKWKNVISDKSILCITENGLKIDLIHTPKSNSKFAFLLLHEEELIVKKEIALLKEKNNYQVKSY